MATTCKILYKGEYYDKNEFNNLLNDPIFKEQIRVSVMTDEFMKMWLNPNMKSMTAADIVADLGRRGLASLNTTSEMQKIKAELAEREAKGLSGEGKPVEVTTKDKTPRPVTRSYVGTKIRAALAWFDEWALRGVMRSKIPSVYEAYQDVKNIINTEMLKVDKVTNKLNKIISDNKSLLTKDDIRSITAIVQGAGMDRLVLPKITDQAKADELRQQIFDVASEMRMHIDNLSAGLINTGFIKEAGVDVYLNNLGKYTARVYETHMNPDGWWEKLTSSDPNMAHIFNTGKNFVSQMLHDNFMTIDDKLIQLNQRISDLENKRSTQTFTKNDTIALEELKEKASRLRAQLKNIDEILNDEAKLEDFIRQSLSNDGGDVVKPGEKRIDADLGLFKKRQEIPVEIRQLMGEVTDPATLYAVTIKRMASFMGKYNFQSAFAIEGEGVLFSTTLDKEKGFTEKIPVARMPAVMEALGLKPGDHIYVMPALVEEIRGAAGLDGSSNMFSKALDALGFLNGIAKAAATKYNPASHLRNFVGAMAFAVSNGYLLSRNFWTAVSTIMSEIKSSTTGTVGIETRTPFMDMVRELAVQNGVLNSNVDIEEIKSLLDNKSMSNFLKNISAKILSPESTEKVSEFLDSKTLENITSLPTNVYEGTDNLFKLAGFLSEMDRQSRLNGYKSFRELTNDLKSTDPAKVAAATKAMEDVGKEAGRKIRRTMPNYAEAWRYNATLKKIPFIGLFTTFVSETIRTSINSSIEFTDALANSVKDPDPARRREYAEIAASRLLGLLVATSVTYFQEDLRSILADMFGGDDEEEKKLKGKSKYASVSERDTFMKYYAPDWVKSIDLRRDPENPDGFIYSDPSSINPFSILKTRVAQREQGGDKSTKWLFSTFSPILTTIFSQEIGFKFVNNLLNGKDMYDNDITPYEFSDDPIKWTKDIATYLGKSPIVPWVNAIKTFGGEESRLDTRIRNDEELLSRTTDSAEREKIKDRIRQNQYKLQEAKPLSIVMSMGYKSNYVDISTQAGFKTYEIADKLQSYKDRYNKNKGESSDIDELYRETNESYQKELKKLRDMIVDTKKNLGVDVTKEVVKVLGNKRFSKKEIAYIKGYSKEAPDVRIKDYETRRG